jgi:hypothetical protein
MISRTSEITFNEPPETRYYDPTFVRTLLGWIQELWNARGNVVRAKGPSLAAVHVMIARHDIDSASGISGQYGRER